MSASLAPPPKALIERDQETNALTEFVTTPFQQWLLSLTQRIQASTGALNVVTLTGQAASIGATSFGTLPAGLYEVTWYARITQAATTSSSLTVTMGWTESGITLAKSFPAITGNTTGTVDSGTFMVRNDSNTLINYSTTYATVGATPMQFRIDLVLRQVN